MRVHTTRNVCIIIGTPAGCEPATHNTESILP